MIELYQLKHEQFLNQMDGMNQLTSKASINFYEFDCSNHK